MRSLKSLSLLLSLSIIVSFSTNAQAGMSVGLEDLEGVIKSNPKFDSLFIDNIEFAPTGTATRLGRHYGAVSGSPVGPYQFKARFSGDEGSDFSLIAVLFTKLLCEDAAGKLTDVPGDTAFVRERLVKVELLDPENLSEEEITKALNTLFEGAEPGGEEGKPMANAEGASTNESGKPLGAGAFSNELKEGDRKFAGEYFCDDYAIAAKAGQKIHVEFQPNGFVPVILTKKDGRYSSSAGRSDGENVNELITFTYVTPKDASVIISLVTTYEGETGPYEARFTLDGKVLTPQSNGEGSGYVTLHP